MGAPVAVAVLEHAPHVALVLLHQPLVSAGRGIPENAVSAVPPRTTATAWRRHRRSQRKQAPSAAMHCALRGLRLTLSCLATAQTARPRGAGAQRRSEAACL